MLSSDLQLAYPIIFGVRTFRMRTPLDILAVMRVRQNVQILDHTLMRQLFHMLPRLLGGDPGRHGQQLSQLDPNIHGAFHAHLRENLRAAGIPPPIGGRGGGTDDWMKYDCESTRSTTGIRRRFRRVSMTPNMARK